jgi:hypothetical protein
MNRNDATLALVKHALGSRHEGAYIVAYLAGGMPLEVLQGALEAVHEMKNTPYDPEPNERLLTLVRERFDTPQ